jgi:UDP-N-acetyl-D-glucosamine dehydrogenase
MLGVAYKANIDDMRESPAIKIAELLADKDAEVVYHDPFVPKFIAGGRDIASVELTEAEVASADAVLVVTNHSNVDYHLVVRSAKLILDTRNALKAFDDNKVVRL